MKNIKVKHDKFGGVEVTAVEGRRRYALTFEEEGIHVSFNRDASCGVISLKELKKLVDKALNIKIKIKSEDIEKNDSMRGDFDLY